MAVVIALAVALIPLPRDLSAAEIPKQKQQVIKTQIRDILSSPEYNRKFAKPPKPSAISRFIERMVERIVKWLSNALMTNAGVGKSMSRILAWCVIGLFVVLVVVIVIRLTSRFRRARGVDASLALERYDLPSSSRLMAEAAKLADSGDFRGAFLRAYLGSISHLDEVEALRFERSRTNWEYLRDLNSRGLDPLADELRPLTSDFDRKLYGHDKCTRDDYDRAVDTYGRIRQMAA